MFGACNIAIAFVLDNTVFFFTGTLTLLIKLFCSIILQSVLILLYCVLKTSIFIFLFLNFPKLGLGLKKKAVFAFFFFLSYGCLSTIHVGVQFYFLYLETVTLHWEVFLLIMNRLLQWFL